MELKEFIKSHNHKEVIQSILYYEGYDLNDKQFDEIYNKYMEDDKITSLLNDDIEDIIDAVSRQ